MRNMCINKKINLLYRKHSTFLHMFLLHALIPNYKNIKISRYNEFFFNYALKIAVVFLRSQKNINRE